MTRRIVLSIMRHCGWPILIAQGCVAVYFGVRWLSKNLMYMNTSTYVHCAERISPHS